MRWYWSCLSAALLLACGGDARDAGDRDMAAELAVREQELAGAGASRAMPAPPPAAAVSPEAASPQPVLPQDSVPPSMIIRTGAARLEVSSLEPAVAAARALVARVGGHIVNLTVQTGREERREATIVTRVPSPRFDELVTGLTPLGEVETVNVNAQDVGEEYVDLQAQVSNRRRLEQRLLELLATRTGRLEDVLAVERELARVREEIDRQEGRLRYLRNQVAMSTLTLVLHEPAPLLSDYRGQNVFTTALQSAWRNFVGLLVAFIAALGVLIPVGLVVWVLWLVVRRRRRRRAVPSS